MPKQSPKDNIKADTDKKTEKPVINMSSVSKKTNSELYTAKMIYTKKNVKAISQLKYNEYNLVARILQIAVGIVLIPIAFFAVKSQIARYVVAGVGLFLVLTNNATPKANAFNFEKVNGGYPSIMYLFRDDSVSSTADKNLFSYNQLTRLVEDDEYLYLFENQLTAFVVDKSTVSGSGGIEGLKSFLEEKTNLKFKRPAGLSSRK